MRKLMTRGKYNRKHGVIIGFALWEQYKRNSADAWNQADAWNDQYEKHRDAMTDKYNATH